LTLASSLKISPVELSSCGVPGSVSGRRGRWGSVEATGLPPHFRVACRAKQSVRLSMCLSSPPQFAQPAKPQPQHQPIQQRAKRFLTLKCQNPWTSGPCIPTSSTKFLNFINSGSGSRIENTRNLGSQRKTQAGMWNPWRREIATFV
jgi:hypothetical protein